MIARELVVIKIPPLRLVFSAHIDHQHSGVVEIALLRLATLDRSTVLRHQQTAGQIVVFVRATRVREDQFDGHERRDGRELRAESKPLRRAGRRCWNLSRQLQGNQLVFGIDLTGPDLPHDADCL